MRLALGMQPTNADRLCGAWRLGPRCGVRHLGEFLSVRRSTATIAHSAFHEGTDQIRHAGQKSPARGRRDDSTVGNQRAERYADLREWYRGFIRCSRVVDRPLL
jgi:hypothetical protein